MKRMWVGWIATALLVCPVARSAPTVGPAGPLEGVVEANNRFALDLYEDLARLRKDLVFSPCSVFEAMGMALAGARGGTLDEIARALHVTGMGPRVHTGLAEAVAGLHADARLQGYKVSVRNALWAQKGYDLHRAFADVARDEYHADIEGADFLGAAAGVRTRIEAWLERTGADSAKGVISPGMLNSDTHVVLVNTVRLRVRGAEPSPRRAGREEAGDAASDPAADDGSLSLVLFLTFLEDRQAVGPRRIEPWRRVGSSTGRPTPQPLRVESHLDLRPSLEDLDVVDAFTGSADFGGLSEDVPLYVADVQHRAWLEEASDGTEAVAVTVIVLNAVPGASGILAVLP